MFLWQCLAACNYLKSPQLDCTFALSLQSYLLPQKAKTLGPSRVPNIISAFLRHFLQNLHGRSCSSAMREEQSLGLGHLENASAFPCFLPGCTLVQNLPGYAMLRLFYTKQPLEGLIIRSLSKIATKQVMIVYSMKYFTANSSQ